MCGVYFNGDLSPFEFIFSIWVKGGKEGKVGPINVLPIIGVTIQCDYTVFELSLDSDLRLGLAAPMTRFLV